MYVEWIIPTTEIPELLYCIFVVYFFKCNQRSIYHDSVVRSNVSCKSTLPIEMKFEETIETQKSATTFLMNGIIKLNIMMSILSYNGNALADAIDILYKE